MKALTWIRKQKTNQMNIANLELWVFQTVFIVMKVSTCDMCSYLPGSLPFRKTSVDHIAIANCVANMALTKSSVNAPFSK